MLVALELMNRVMFISPDTVVAVGHPLGQEDTTVRGTLGIMLVPLELMDRLMFMSPEKVTALGQTLIFSP
jgi:hypothetical protein